MSETEESINDLFKQLESIGIKIGQSTVGIPEIICNFDQNYPESSVRKIPIKKEVADNPLEVAHQVENFWRDRLVFYRGEEERQNQLVNFINRQLETKEAEGVEKLFQANRKLMESKEENGQIVESYQNLDNPHKITVRTKDADTGEIIRQQTINLSKT